MGRSKFLADGLKLFDVFAMALWFVAAATLVLPSVDYGTLRQFFELRMSVGNVFFFAAFAIFWHVLFTAFGLYGNFRFYNSYREIGNLVKATTLGSFAIVVLAVPFDFEFVSLRFLFIFWLGTTLLSIGGRYVTRLLLKQISKQDNNLSKLLIVGLNDRSLNFASRIEKDPGLGYRLIGFADDSWSQVSDFDESGFDMVAALDELPKYLRKTALDEVLICLPIKSRYEDTLKVVSICEEQGITVGILGDLLQCKLANSRAEMLGDDTLIMVRPHAISGIQASIKHSLDFIISAALLIFLSPFILIAALIIKLTSPGPVFFTQERIGRNKKRFRMIKFRTMVQDAEQKQADLEHLNEASGAAFKIKYDPRITPVGRFMRKMSIDEIPQLINVLRGEMSLVGPRPLPLRDYEEFQEDWHRRRVSVRPGLTCLWQVNGRNHKSFDEWMELDLQYINSWSLLLDFKVLLLTIPAVLRGSGD